MQEYIFFFILRWKKRKELIRLAEEKEVKVYGLSEYYVGEKDREQNESVILLGYANMSDEKSCMRLVCLMKHGIKREIDKSV